MGHQTKRSTIRLVIHRAKKAVFSRLVRGVRRPLRASAEVGRPTAALVLLYTHGRLRERDRTCLSEPRRRRDWTTEGEGGVSYRVGLGQQKTVSGGNGGA